MLGGILLGRTVHLGLQCTPIDRFCFPSCVAVCFGFVAYVRPTVNRCVPVPLFPSRFHKASSRYLDRYGPPGRCDRERQKRTERQRCLIKEQEMVSVVQGPLALVPTVSIFSPDSPLPPNHDHPLSHPTSLSPSCRDDARSSGSAVCVCLSA